MNQVVLIGRLTRDPELRYIPGSGTAVTRFSIAVARQFKKEGQPDADFFNIVVWGKPAESAAQYLVKGRLVAVNGNMRNNNYEDKNGVKHYNIEIVASRVEFLEWATNNRQQSQNGSQYQNNQNNPQQTQGYQQNNNHHQQNQRSQTGYQQDYNGFQAIDGDDDIPF
ncbi:MAG: single-stranded DNA-binding protein [Clostridiales bacterium]|nr:single-stranded DNA-binding protein [Clostridiales bacterium]